MKKFISIASVVFILSGCVTTPHDSPEIRNEFRQAQRTVNDCLAEQLLKLVQIQDDPNIAAQVAADRCMYTAMQEARRLEGLNTNQNVVKGFNGKLTNKAELRSQSMNVLMMLIEEANK